jgi:threonine dehydrogenase-like Zn-dependent dehydrogenase
MKAIAVFPRKPNSVHLADLASPRVEDVPSGRGVRVRVLSVGVDGTDREINAGEYGSPPKGSDFLVLGHENLGRVEEVGAAVTDLRPGDYVVASVRRPGGSLYDLIGMSDMTTDDVCYERGISLLHGFLTEEYVDDAAFLVRIPAALREIGVLLEPLTVAEKGLAQAYEIQRRLRVWRPRRAAVMGAGTIGLMATLWCRLRGLEVTTFALEPPPHLNADLVGALGGRYVSTKERSLADETKSRGPFDLIFEATGFSPMVFESMEALAKNGVLVLSSVTGGDRRVEVPADRLNLGFVLGNKVMVGTVNASRASYEAGVSDMALAEALYPGWLGRLLTHPVPGLDRYAELFETLTSARRAIKVFCEVSALSSNAREQP